MTFSALAYVVGEQIGSLDVFYDDSACCGGERVVASCRCARNRSRESWAAAMYDAACVGIVNCDSSVPVPE